MNVSLLPLLLPLLVSPAAETADSERPALLYEDTSRLGRPFAKDPSVIRFGDRALMYYSLPPYAPDLAPPGAPEGWTIGIAASDDLIHWARIGELLPEQAAEGKGICAPGARVLGGRVHLFYQTYGNGTKDAICHAVSDDGVQFTRDASNPIFRPEGDWTVGRAIDAEVFPIGDRLWLYYATRDPSMADQMLGAASAPIDSDYGRKAWRQEGSGPILKPELPWERHCIEAATIVRRGGSLIMFYAGAYNNEPQQIGVAISRDGLRWTRLSDEPLVPNGAPGSWNSSESGHPGAFVDAEDGRVYLFYQGNDDRGRTWRISCLEIVWENGQPVPRPFSGR